MCTAISSQNCFTIDLLIFEPSFVVVSGAIGAEGLMQMYPLGLDFPQSFYLSSCGPQCWSPFAVHEASLVNGGIYTYLWGKG